MQQGSSYLHLEMKYKSTNHSDPNTTHYLNQTQCWFNQSLTYLALMPDRVDYITVLLKPKFGIGNKNVDFIVS